MDCIMLHTYTLCIYCMHVIYTLCIYCMHVIYTECVQLSRNRVQTSCDSVSDFLKIFESIADLQALRVVGVLGE